MVVAVEFSFPGDAAKQFRLATVRFQEFAEKPFRGLGGEIVEWFEDRTAAHWKSEGSRGPGGKWAPWAPSTAARKKPGDRLMIESGRMRGALLESSHPDALRRVDDDSVELGIQFENLDAPYPRFHQAGGRNLPRRRGVDMLESDGIALLKILQNQFVSRAKASGFISGKRSAGISRAF